MKYEDLKEIFEHENNFVSIEIEGENKPTLTFNYTDDIDFATLYHLADTVVAGMTTVINEDDGNLIPQPVIDYGMNDPLTIYAILSTFTDLPLEGDVALAYELDTTYNIIFQIADINDRFAKKIEYLHQTIWKMLEFDKHNQTAQIIDRAFKDIKNYLIELGFKTLEEHNIDIEDFIKKVTEVEKLESTK